MFVTTVILRDNEIWCHGPEWAFWGNSQRGSVSSRPCRWVTGPEEQKTRWLTNNVRFFNAICDHKERFLSPMVRALLWSSTPSLWGDSSGPHRFSHTHSPELSKRSPVSFLTVSKKISMPPPPTQTVWSRDILRPVLVMIHNTNTTTQWRHTRLIFSSKAKRELHNDNVLLQHTCGRRGQHHHSVHRSAIRHVFIEVLMGQSTASVPGLTSRGGSARRCPHCWSQTACHLCFVSLVGSIDQVQWLRQAPSASLVQSN